MEVNEIVLLDKERIAIADTIKSEIAETVNKSTAVVIKCDSYDDSALAGQNIDKLRAFTNAVEDKRLQFGRKINAFKKGWDEFFRGISDPAQAEITRIKVMVTGYQTVLREEQAEAERKRQVEIDKRIAQQAAHEAKGHKIDPTPRESLVPEVAPIKTKMAVKMRTIWRYEITDETKVPKDYLMVDTTKIQRSITRKDNPVRDIPGVKIYSEDIPT